MQSKFFEVGKKYLVRSVLYNVGELKGMDDYGLILTNASFIPETAKYHDTLSKGIFNEIEPYLDDVFIPWCNIFDATEFKHDLPTKQFRR